MEELKLFRIIIFLPIILFSQKKQERIILGSTRVTSDEPFENTTRWVFNDSVQLLALSLIEVDGKEFFKVAAVHFPLRDYHYDPHHMGYMPVSEKYNNIKKRIISDSITSLEIAVPHETKKTLVVIQNGDTLEPLEYQAWTETHLYYRVRKGMVTVLNTRKKKFEKKFQIADVRSPYYLKVNKTPENIERVDSFYYARLVQRRNSGKYSINFYFSLKDDHFFGKIQPDSISWSGEIINGFANGHGQAYLHKGKDTFLIYSGKLRDGLPEGEGCFFGSHYTLCGDWKYGELYKRKSFALDLNRSKVSYNSPAILETKSESWTARDSLTRMQGLFRKMTVDAADTNWYFSHLKTNTNAKSNISLLPVLNSCAEHVFLIDVEHVHYHTHIKDLNSSWTKYQFLVQCKNKKLFEIKFSGNSNPDEKDEKQVFETLIKESEKKCGCQEN